MFFINFRFTFFCLFAQRRKYDGSDYGLDHHQLTAEQLQQLQDETDPLEWQTAALFLAVLACLLFFIVAACILVHHMRQWRRMERRLDQGKFVFCFILHRRRDDNVVSGTRCPHLPSLYTYYYYYVMKSLIAYSMGIT